ncbi:MAG: hypothetical protein AAFO69_12675, partial [Bacteroidota bacterium]
MLRTNLIALILLTTLSVYAQLPQRAAPFTAVEWEGDFPVVRVDGDWYQISQIDSLQISDILEFAKQHHPTRWKKRFGEDLMQLFEEMQYRPGKTVLLSLYKDQQRVLLETLLTFENRQMVVRYNREKNRKDPATLMYPSGTALADLQTYEQLLQST